MTQTHGTIDNINKYKILEKEVNVKLKNAKRGMEKRLANSGNNNARTFANYIKSKTKSRTGIGPLKEPDGKLVTDNKDISEKLNTFFASVFTIEDETNIPVRGVETNVILQHVIFAKGQIRAKIKGLKSNSAPGPDGISTQLLQNTRKSY